MSADPELALSKLTSLLNKVSFLKGQTASSPEFRAWEGDVKIALSKFYGVDSEEYARFGAIWFTPGSYYPGQPKSELVAALDRGLEQATLDINHDSMSASMQRASSSTRAYWALLRTLAAS